MPLNRSAIFRVSSRCCFWFQAYRHHVRLVGQDIRRHQAGIGEQANVNVIGVLLGLSLNWVIRESSPNWV